MPRNQNAGNLALRNRNRVTNKTRLKVIRGNIDADPIVLDEDEERIRVVSTAGVDAEDANEHHLQAVLSAASHRATTLQQRAINGADKVAQHKETLTAFIPVPDAAGVVDNYDELYPSDKWKEPATYVKSSITVDECVTLALADGFTYVMDERDAEWLDKNNQEARGEGTSAQTTTSGTTTRSGGHRSAKARGKEAESNTTITIFEDEFELVMGLFEKISHDSTPFLHVTFQQQQGSCIPPFSDYQDILANELPTSMFASFLRPANLPTPPSIVRLARIIYFHWRERKIEREGQRIIPTLNFDEGDTKNESYICFRRRDVKSVRKTRTAQVSTTDKLLRLKSELASAYELARNILHRETQKREALLETKALWEKRMALVDLKRKFSILGGRDEEELLFDRERIPKRPKLSDPSASQMLKLKSRPSGDASASPAPAEPQIRPRERLGLIQNAIEEQLKHTKERDHHWDDQLDNPFQQPLITFSDKLFKAIRLDEPSATSSGSMIRAPQYLRARPGRGGRMHLDRRRPSIRLKLAGKDVMRLESRRPISDDDSLIMDAKQNEERLDRLAERWRYDSDSQALAGADGNEEEDRTLYDDFDPKNIRFSLSLLQDQEHIQLVTDPRLYLFDPQMGSYNYVIPSRIAATPQRRESSAQQRPPTLQPQAPPQVSAAVQAVTMPTQATPVAMQTPVKRIAPPMAAQHNRVPSVGPQRPSSSASQGSSANGAAGPGSSPTATTTQIPVKSGHGMVMAAGAHVMPNISGQVSSNGQILRNGSVEGGSSNHNGSPSRPQSQNQGLVANVPQQNIGHNGFAANGTTNGVPVTQVNGINGINGTFSGYNVPANYIQITTQQQQLMHQHQQRKLQMAQNLQIAGGNASRPGQQTYTQHMQANAGGINGINGVNGVNNIAASLNGNMMNQAMHLKNPRQLPWTSNSTRSQQVPHGGDASLSPNLQNTQLAGLNGLLHMSGVNGHISPPRPTHSPNSLPGTSAHQMVPHAMSPHMNSPSLTHLTPPRNAQTPIPPSPSPLLQHQHIVGSLPQGQNY